MPAAAAPSPSPSAAAHQRGKPLSRSQREAAFLRTVDRQRTASVVTGDLSFYAGSPVAYVCDVEEVLQKGFLGQCGADEEPVDLFIDFPKGRVKKGQRLRVLGILEAPIPWTDVFGHTVYYAFVRAVFVDPMTAAARVGS